MSAGTDLRVRRSDGSLKAVSLDRILFFATESLAAVSIEMFACPTCGSPAGKRCGNAVKIVDQVAFGRSESVHGSRRRHVPARIKIRLVLEGMDAWKAAGRLSAEGLARLPADQKRLAEMLDKIHAAESTGRAPTGGAS